MLKNERLSTPLIKNPMSPIPLAFHQPVKKMEIFNHSQNLDKRLEYQFPKSIHGLIKDISLKHNHELKEHELLIQHEQTLKKSRRRKRTSIV